MDYYMQFLEFRSFLQKRGLSYGIHEISFSSEIPGQSDAIMKFLSLLQKCCLSNAILVIYFPSPKTWTIICIFGNFVPFSKNMYYHKQFMKFLSLLQKHGLSYAIYEFSFSSPKTRTTYAFPGI